MNNSDSRWRWGLGFASLIVGALVWQGLALQLDSLLLPTFTDTIAALVHLAAGRELWSALWLSNQAAVLGFCCAAVAGIGIGVVTARWPLAEKVMDPYLNILLAVPKAALIPVLIMATGGVGMLPRVLVVFSFSIVSIAVNTRAGFRLVDRTWLDMARVFGATEAQLWRTIKLPAARPGIMTGLRLGLIQSISGMITVELLLLAVGVGRLILDYQFMFEAALMYATILVVVAESVLMMEVLTWIGRRAPQRINEAALE